MAESTIAQTNIVIKIFCWVFISTRHHIVDARHPSTTLVECQCRFNVTAALSNHFPPHDAIHWRLPLTVSSGIQVKEGRLKRFPFSNNSIMGDEIHILLKSFRCLLWFIRWISPPTPSDGAILTCIIPQLHTTIISEGRTKPTELRTRKECDNM